MTTEARRKRSRRSEEGVMPPTMGVGRWTNTVPQATPQAYRTEGQDSGYLGLSSLAGKSPACPLHL